MGHSNDLLNAALGYAMRGWPVFPCHPESKRPLLKGGVGEDGKEIPNTGGVKKASCDPLLIREWWARWPSAMIGFAVGTVPGFFVLDFDAGTDAASGEAYTAEGLRASIEAAIGVSLPATWAIETPRGGRHLYFRMPAELIGNRAGLLGKGSRIDVRGEGGYVILPPSARPDGKGYAWLTAPAHKDELPAEAPIALLDLILRRGKWAERIAGDRSNSGDRQRSNGSVAAASEPFKRHGDADLDAAGQAAVRKYGGTAFVDDLAKLKGSIEGQRNDDLFHTAIRFAQLVAAGALDGAMAKRELIAVAEGWPNARKSAGTIESGWRKGLGEPRDLREVYDKAVARARRQGAPGAPKTSGRQAGLFDPYSIDAELRALDGARPPDPPPPDFSDFESATLPPGAGRSRSAARSHDRVRIKTGGAKKPPDENERQKALHGELAFYPQTDLGNAERFASRWSGRLLWCPSIGWLFWDGKRWSSDGAEGRVKMAEHETVRAIQEEADWLIATGADREVGTKGRGKDEETVMLSDTLRSWGRASEENRRLTPIAKRAAPYLEAKASDLDAGPFKINVGNGTLSITRENGKAVIEFTDHDPGDRITKLAPVKYDPEARCPKFDGFLEMVQGDPAMRRFLMQWLGYSFTGDTSEQMLTFHHGKGKNGKSTLFEIAGMIMGDYGRSIRIETFLDQGRGNTRAGGAPTPDLAALSGVRYLRTSEPERGAKLAEALIKLATGGEPMSVRFLNREFFDMLPVFKLTMSGNYKPQIIGTDEGIWRRVRLVPWVVEIPRDQRVKDFHKVKLWPEAPGILNWLISGIVDWIEHGLVEPEEVIKATAQYRADSDPLGRFLAVCVKPETGAQVQASRLHELFVAWAKANGEREWSAKGFGGAMRERGFLSKHSDVNWYLNVKIIKTVGDFVDAGGKPHDDAAAMKARAGVPDDEIDW